MNTVQSALSLVIFLPEGCTFRSHPVVCRLSKGVFTTRPSLPQYHSVWDIAIVLRYLKALHPTEETYLRDLKLKITQLMALLSCRTTSENSRAGH